MNESAEPRRRRRWAVSLGTAAATGLAVGLCTAVGLALGVGEGLRADTMDEAHTSADADPDIVVVGIDRDYIESTRAGENFAISLMRAILTSEASTIVASRDISAVYAGYLQVGLSLEGVESMGIDAVGALAGDRWVPGRYEPALESPPTGSGLPVLPVAAYSLSGDGSAQMQGLSETLGHDGRGVLRRVPVVAVTDEEPARVLPSLGLLVLQRALGSDPELEEWPGELRLGDRRIPTEADHRVRVSYADELLPGGDQVMPAGELVDYWVNVGLGDDPAWGAGEPPFPDQVVFFGVTDPDIAEMIPTPVGPQPAVIVEANAANTLLTEQYLRPVPHWQLSTAAGVLAFLVALVTLLLPLLLTPLAPVLGGWVWWWSTWQLADDGWLGDLVVGFGAVGIAFVAALAWRAAVELRRRREVSGLFSRYVPDTVAHELLDTGLVDSVVAGQRLEVTVLFCDLRHFTALAARLDPHQVRELLDHYYEYTSQLILDHGGTLMQYVGDEVFAVWGAPLDDPHHAQRALDCAIAMQAERSRLDDTLKADGLPPIRFGIGLNSGEVVAAHTGSSLRRQYSVLGDTVNVGARLCSVAEPDQIVLADDTRERLTDPPPALVDTGRLDLKGVRPDYHAWRLAPLSAPAPATP